ncbi:MAG: diaminopimelate decarboxylase [Planctomycetes bacterium]|nr:diaminopimelate decarboxylase [Planctomycetota bacterium]MBI3835920.1 diaminopimelate decarboxylase [Planctomycetota bacterium]
MDHFVYKSGQLQAEGVRVEELAEKFGTPLYVYSRQTFVDHFRRFQAAFAELNPCVCFSVKSCQNLAVLRLLHAEGASFDVVSGGELRRVREIGAPPESVVFAGVGKTNAEIRDALEFGIGWFNVESVEELENIARLTGEVNRMARVALRVNPDVDPHTHEYTTTGKRGTKFGIDFDASRRASRAFANDRNICIAGLHLHLGSPVNSAGPYVEAIEKTLRLIDEIRRDGITITAINLGGGFGAHYQGGEAPSAASYADQIVPLLRDRGLEVLFEPGRSIAANAGVLLTRVLYTKRSGARKYVIVDAAITELIRPALYGAYHFVWPVAAGEVFVPAHRGADLRMAGTELVDVVGPVCESGDFLAKERWMPPLKRGDLVCIYSAGAYGMTMSSQYNSRPRAPEVLVENDRGRLIRRRETYNDLVAAEREI